MSMTDLEIVVAALAGKRADIDALEHYYEGTVAVPHMTDRLAQLFASLNIRVTENWCAMVIDTLADRIQLDAILSSEDNEREAIQSAWQEMAMEVESDEVHEMALIAGESYLVAWLDAETQEPQAHYHDPRMCVVIYDDENPSKKRVAGKWWVQSDGAQRLTLYYADRIEKYITEPHKSQAGTILTAGKFKPFGDDFASENPFNEIPVFHFKNKNCKSDLLNAIPIQNAINKLLVDMVVSSEFAAIPQKYAITNADTSNLKNGPGQLWNIPAGDGIGQQSSVGQFAAADLSNYSNQITGLVEALGAITQTPRHLFTASGNAPSGESLIAMETPLVKKAEDRIKRFTPEWRRFGKFLLKLLGFTSESDSIQPVFAPASTVLPVTQATIRKEAVAAGIPLETQLKSEGWTDAEIEEMQQDKLKAELASGDSLATALVTAQRRFDSGGLQDNG